MLESYAILDLELGHAYQAAVTVAARLLHAPFASFSVVDRDCQVCKVAVGLTVSRLRRAGSLDSHAVMSRAVFTVPDVRTDARFVNDPVVLGEPRIRFYAAKSIVTPAAAAIGVLSVMDTAPRELTAEEGMILEAVAGQIMNMLEERRIATVRDWLLTAIDGEASGVLGRIRNTAAGALRASVSDADARRALRLLRDVENLDSLMSSVRNLADLALRTAPPTAVVRPTDLREVVAAVVEEIAEGLGVTFHFEAEGDCVGNWNRDCLLRAATLLIEEARARSAENATVRVRALGADADHVLLEVKIPATIGEPGVRIHLARELMLTQGARIDFQREPAETTFSVTLPRNP